MSRLWKIAKYFLLSAIGAVISLSIAQQKFPPDFKMFGRTMDLQRKLASEKVRQYQEIQKIEVENQSEDPFDEALELHEKQREHWQNVDHAVNGTVHQLLKRGSTTTTLPPKKLEAIPVQRKVLAKPGTEKKSAQIQY